MSWRTIWPEAASVECPKCGTWAGYPCITKSGQETHTPHAARIKEGQRLLRASADQMGDDEKLDKS